MTLMRAVEMKTCTKRVKEVKKCEEVKLINIHKTKEALMERYQEGQSFPEKYVHGHSKLNNSPTGKQMDLTTENYLRHSDLLKLHAGASPGHKLMPRWCVSGQMNV